MNRNNKVHHGSLSQALLVAASVGWMAAHAQVEENPLRDAYFGETHMHTAYSLDAYIGGNRQTPDMAYRFAKGEAWSRCFDALQGPLRACQRSDQPTRHALQ